MRIDKETAIFCSFAEKAGNNGCKMFNAAFNYYRLNALYKSFSVDDIGKAVLSARILNFKGFAITMPFKKEVVSYVDDLSDEVLKIGSANTVINNDGILKAYNTDYLAAQQILIEDKVDYLYILGNGGYSAAVQYAARKNNIDFDVIDRKRWHEIEEIKNSFIFNCTPVIHLDRKIDNSNKYIDCIVETKTGKRLSVIQASYQFKLYTGLDFPIKEDI